jgi:hypothetical protein
MNQPATLKADEKDLQRVLVVLSNALDAETKERPINLPTLLFIAENFVQIVMDNLYKCDPSQNWKGIILETLPQILQDRQMEQKGIGNA